MPLVGGSGRRWLQLLWRGGRRGPVDRKFGIHHHQRHNNREWRKLRLGLWQRGPLRFGAGGAIRLVSGLIAGSGSVTAGGGGVAYGYSCGATTTAGIVRLEAYQITYTGFRTIAATPVGLFLPSPTSQPSIVVTSVGGVPVATSPTGSFVMPDVTVNSSSPLTVVIQATNVPPGTTATLYTTTENFPDQKIISNPFAGTMASSTATATITLQPGYSLGYVTATWTQ